MTDGPESKSSTLFGILCAIGAFFCFPLHDAIIKWLVEHYLVWQILFVRSAMAMILAIALGGGRQVLARASKSPSRRLLFGRAFVVMAAWICFYSAAKSLKLAELVTIYFASPLLVAALAIWVLGERISGFRWCCLSAGFAGIIVACRPEGSGHALAIGLAVIAAVLWAYSMILIRQLGTRESTAVQMIIGNSVICIFTGISLPFVWKMPGPTDVGLLLAVGIVGTAAQYLLFESARRAPAAVVASMEFTSLVWAFVLGFLIWGDVPGKWVFIGAGLIIVSGLLVMGEEWLQSPRGRVAFSIAMSSLRTKLQRPKREERRPWSFYD